MSFVKCILCYSFRGDPKCHPDPSCLHMELSGYGLINMKIWSLDQDQKLDTCCTLRDVDIPDSRTSLYQIINPDRRLYRRLYEEVKGRNLTLQPPVNFQNATKSTINSLERWMYHYFGLYSSVRP